MINQQMIKLTKLLEEINKNAWFIFKSTFPDGSTSYGKKKYPFNNPEVYQKWIISNTKNAIKDEKGLSEFMKKISSNNYRFQTDLVFSSNDEQEAINKIRELAYEDEKSINNINMLGTKSGGSVQLAEIPKEQITRIQNDIYVSELYLNKNKELKKRIDPNTSLKKGTIRFFKIKQPNHIKII